MTDAKLPWLVAAALAAAVAPARAGGALIRPPAGWHSDPEQATALGQRYAAAAQAKHHDAITAAEAYLPDKPGLALFATRLTLAPGAGSTAGQLARLAVDDLRASLQRAGLSGGHAHEDAWQVATDAASKQIVATLTWSEPASHTVDHARLVIASDGTKLVVVTGECLGLDDAPRAAVDACLAALGSLDPGIALASRVAIALPDTAAADAADASPSAPSMTATPSGLDDGSVHLPPRAIALDPPAPDRRPMYLGGGILVLAALFWWNRKQREQIERAELRAERRERDGGRVPRAERRARPARDDDGDDLHAAARGDDSTTSASDTDANADRPPRDPS